MQISNLQPTQNLFLNEHNVLTNQSPENLHGAEQTAPQNNLHPSQDEIPQSYSAIRRSQPNNRPQLTLIKTDKTGHQKWNPLAKLALASACVIKATALGYLAYTYKSTSPEIPATNPTSKDLNDHVVQHLQNSESTPTQSTLPLIVRAATATIVIGGIFGYCISKLKKEIGKSESSDIKNLDKLRITASKRNTKEQNERQQIIDEPKELNAEKKRLEVSTPVLKKIEDLKTFKAAHEILRTSRLKNELEIVILKIEMLKEQLELPENEHNELKRNKIRKSEKRKSEIENELNKKKKPSDEDQQGNSNQLQIPLS